MLGILIPCMWGFKFIFKIKGSKPRAYKNIEREQSCPTKRLILNDGVKVPFTRILGSMNFLKYYF